MSLPSQPDDLEGYSTLNAIMELGEDDDNAVAPAIRENGETEMDEYADDAVAPGIKPDAGNQAPGRDEPFGEANAESARHLEQEHAPLRQHASPEGPDQRVQPPRKNKGQATPTTATQTFIPLYTSSTQLTRRHMGLV